MSEIQNFKTNLNGESNSRISLIAEINDMDMPVNWYIVVDGTEKVKVTPEEGRYFLSEVKFDDIDGDKKAGLNKLFLTVIIEAILKLFIICEIC